MPKLRFGKLIGPKAVILTAVVLAFMVGTCWAAHRPTPLMDYAPQETGIYDTYYDYLQEVDCRYCHGASLADRHHYAPDGIAGNCTKCHLVAGPPDYGVTVYRDCRYSGTAGLCHADFTNGWHHNNQLAASRQCTACHNPQILGTITPFQDPALYPPTVVTPSPFSCENCHWSQPVTNKHPSTDIHYDPWGVKIANFDDPGGQFAQQPGEWKQNSPADDGYHYSLDPLSNTKPLLDNQGTHHMLMQGAVSAQCSNCHANDPGDPSWDPNDPILIRYCERCHDIKSIHRVPGHVDATELWLGFMWGNNNKAWEAAEITPSADGSVYRTFTRDDRCMGCHGDTIWGMTPPYDTCTPSVTAITPQAGEPGANVVLTGTCFGEEWMPGVGVKLQPTAGGAKTSVPIVSWTNTQVIWLLPGWLFPVGNYNVFLTAMKWNDTDSDGQIDPGELVATEVMAPNAFSVTDHPTLQDIDTNADHPVPAFPVFDTLAATPGPADASGPYYCRVALLGSGGFGATPNRVAGDIKIQTSVALTRSTGSPPGGGLAGSLLVPVGQTIGGIVRNSVTLWNDTRIDFNMQDLWTDNNGNGCVDAGDVCESPDNIAPGDYAIRVVSVYYNDVNSNGKPDQTDAEAPAGTATNELTQTCTSDPVSYHLTNTPWIWWKKESQGKPATVPVGMTLKVTGANFGTSPSDSTVNIYKCTAGGGVGVLKATLRASDMGTKIRGWTNTMLKIKVGGVAGTLRWVSVTVNGVESNKMKVRVI